MAGGSVPLIKWDGDAIELKIVTQHFIVVICIKCRVPNESTVRKRRVCFEEIFKYRTERSRVADFFVKIRVVSFLKVDFRMATPKTVVKEGNVPNDAEAIGQYASFVSVAEMTIHILLFDKWIGNSGIRHF